MVKFGILGCGSIARRMADALHRCDSAELIAVAARDLSRAEAFATENGAERAYGSYEELARDADIDAVYVATIHPNHASSVALCLNAGKAVLCEKPLGMTRAEGEAMFDLAHEKKLLLMEAMWTRCLPAWRKAKELIDAGVIGQVKTVFTDYTFLTGFDPESRLYNIEKGGGGMLDVGVYSLHCALSVLGTDIKSVQVAGRRSPTGSDCYAAITLSFGNGAVAVASCGMDCFGSTCEGRIMGETGALILPGMAGADTCILRRAGQPDKTYHFPCENSFIYEVEEFCRLLKAGETESSLVPPAHTLEVAGIIDTAMAKLE